MYPDQNLSGFFSRKTLKKAGLTKKRFKKVARPLEKLAVKVAPAALKSLDALVPGAGTAASTAFTAGKGIYDEKKMVKKLTAQAQAEMRRAAELEQQADAAAATAPAYPPWLIPAGIAAGVLFFLYSRK